jgi:5,5'-dehydrodivanillate O-demethylase
LGLVFGYFGEGEAPPFPRYPEFEGEGVLDVGHYTRPCNFWNQLESNMDELHVSFVHRDSAFTTFGLNEDLPEIDGEESDWGVTKLGKRANGVVRVSQFGMPNILYIMGSPEDAGTGWTDHLAWRVPIDDVTHQSFQLALTHVTGEAAERLRQRQAERRAKLAELPSSHELARAVLRGELRVHDLGYRPDIVNIQDHVAQMGQGIVANLERERLGRSDVLVILFRKIWERELGALAEGRPLKDWQRTDRLMVTAGV